MDYAASTPVDPRVLKAMQPYFSDRYGNPGSLHSFGQAAMAAVDQARESLAYLMGVRFEEIIFTGSATEANNLAISGAVACFRKNNPAKTPHLIVSAIEHESVLELARSLESGGFLSLSILPVDKEGFVGTGALKGLIREETVLVSVMRGNNEVGVLEDITGLAEEIAHYRAGHKTRYPLFHTDASQSFPYEGLRPKDIGLSLATVSSQKCYGPKGVGALFVSSEVGDLVQPMVSGGGQEFGLRSGTENVPGIVGFAKAAEISASLGEKESKRLMGLKDYFLKELKKAAKVSINGNLSRVKSVVYKRELPHILSVHFSGFSAADLLVAMDLAGLAISAGSACRSRSNEPSYVIQALGLGDKRAEESLRFSFGRKTDKTELKTALKIIKKALKVY